jgi:DNA-binding PadR family transcriptional regulator
MEREGPVHGYGISERIAERTEGAWRPGPGSVYPSLQKLVLSGYARPRTEGRRRVYTITPKGRAALAEVRGHGAGARESRADLSSLWAEVMGTEGVGGLLLLRLRRTVDSIESYLAQDSARPGPHEALRDSVVVELAQSLKRIHGSGPPGDVAPRSRQVLHAH